MPGTHTAHRICMSRKTHHRVGEKHQLSRHEEAEARHSGVYGSEIHRGRFFARPAAAVAQRRSAPAAVHTHMPATQRRGRRRHALPARPPCVRRAARLRSSQSPSPSPHSNSRSLPPHPSHCSTQPSRVPASAHSNRLCRRPHRLTAHHTQPVAAWRHVHYRPPRLDAGVTAERRWRDFAASPRPAAPPGCDSSSSQSTGQPWCTHMGCPYRETAASDPSLRAAWQRLGSEPQ